MGQNASASKAGARLRLLAHTGNTAELRKHVGVMRDMCNAWLAKEQERHARSSEPANPPVSRLPAILNSTDAVRSAAACLKVLGSDRVPCPVVTGGRRVVALHLWRQCKAAITVPPSSCSRVKVWT